MQPRGVTCPSSLQCYALISHGLLLLLLAGLCGAPAWEGLHLRQLTTDLAAPSCSGSPTAFRMKSQALSSLPSPASSPPFPSPSPSIPNPQVQLSHWWTGNPQLILALWPPALLTLGLFTCCSLGVNSLPPSAWMTCPLPLIPSGHLLHEAFSRLRWLLPSAPCTSHPDPRHSSSHTELRWYLSSLPLLPHETFIPSFIHPPTHVSSMEGRNYSRLWFNHCISRLEFSGSLSVVVSGALTTYLWPGGILLQHSPRYSSQKPQILLISQMWKQPHREVKKVLRGHTAKRNQKEHFIFLLETLNSWLMTFLKMA